MKIPNIPHKEDIERFIGKIVASFKPNTIILYGSMARGDYGVGSDIDIIVIAKNLPESLDERLKVMAELNDTTAPIECLAYTPREFRRMLKHTHPTALYAMDDGIILYDDGTVVEMREIFMKMKKTNIIKRFKHGWIICKRGRQI